MGRSTVPGFALFVLLVAGACGGPSTASPASQPAASQPATSAAATSGTATACHTPAANEPVTSPVTVSIADRTYNPDPVHAKVGELIEWHNEDAVPHTATLDDIDCDTGQLIRGQKGALVFTEAGTYAYHCRIHSTLHGTITVAP